MVVENIYRAFLFFMRQEYNLKKKINERMIKSSEVFLQELQKHYHLDQLGEDFLWNYFIFQFNFWKTAKLKRNVEIDISFVIGKKALNRYLNRDQQYDWQILNDKRNYDQKEFQDIIGLKKKENQSLNFEEEIDIDDLYRRKYFNTQEGFDHCMENTLLYSQKSSFCNRCEKSQICKEVQKIVYPVVYKNRNGEKR